MRKKKSILIILILLSCILIASSIICIFIIPNNQNYFITLPFVTDESCLLFELFDQPRNMFFSIKSPGAFVFEKLSPFCINKSCSIPMVIGGQVTLEIFLKKQVIFSDLLVLPHLTMNCTQDPWTNRICTFHNICYNKDDTFSFESPYKIQFESEFICLGSKTPPVDLELNRLSSDKFKVVHKFNTIIQQRIIEPSNLISIYYNMHMLWHSYYDYLLPLYQTLKLFSNDKNFKSHRIFLPNFVPEIPNLTQSLSKYKVEKLKSPLCFDDLTIGMQKITDLSLNKDDPPYSFCKNCSCGLRDAVLEYFNITIDNHDSKSLNFVFLGRKSITRKILNEDELNESLKKNLTSNSRNDHFQFNYFELMPLKKQIEIISKTDVLMSVHGSGLANILFMKPGSVVIEIMPNGFDCRDWYLKAAEAAGVKYFAYYAKSDGETVGGNEVEAKKCMKQRKKCQSKKCIDILRDRDIKIDVTRFIDELNKFLKSTRIF